MTGEGRLLTKDVAERVGLRVDTIRSYRVRGTFPPPDGYLLGIHPWWRQETVEAWLRGRRARQDHAVRANPEEETIDSLDRAGMTDDDPGFS